MSDCKKIKKFSGIKVKDLCAKNICTDNIKAKDTTVTNLNVTFINGKNVKCEDDQSGTSIQREAFDRMNDGIPIKPARVNQAVYDALLANANEEYENLQERLTRGREIIQKFEKDKSCNICGDTGAVPLTVYGYITEPLLSEKVCGFTGGTGPNGYSSQLLAVQKMFYNLEVDYDVLVAQSVQPRIISILCHLAFIDPFDNTPYLEEIIIGNKQFSPTVDPLYGEMFSGTIPLDSDLVAEAISAMPDVNNCAAVQLVFYIEEGITIWTQKETPADGIETFKRRLPSANFPSYSELTNPPGTNPCNISVDFKIDANALTVRFSLFAVNLDKANGFMWDFGDGNTSTQSDPTHTYAEANNYNVTLSLTYINTSCPPAVISKEITVF